MFKIKLVHEYLLKLLTGTCRYTTKNVGVGGVKTPTSHVYVSGFYISYIIAYCVPNRHSAITYIICIFLQVTSTVNNSLINTPLTVVGNASDLIHTNPLNSTSNFTNIISTSDVSTNLPLNYESSTFDAFFMSEMERMSTVKTITEMDFK